jgi:hypothetical protein
MTTKSTAPTSSVIAAPVILFGIDASGKPKAARFASTHAGLAIKAASQLQLRVVPSTDLKSADLAARVPVGRIHATGKTFVPFVARDLYDKLIAAAPHGGANDTQGASGSDAAGAPAGSGPTLPRSWREIGRGDLVIAQDSPEEGWFDAIVMGLNGDMATLRWRDYPRERQVVRHRNRLGLLYPGPTPSAETSKTPKATTPKQDKPTPDQRPSAAQPLAHDWQDIDANHLVLAKHDGPRPAWWEAIAIETKDDRVKVRWRDFPAIPPISRSRFDLALLCADAG